MIQPHGIQTTALTHGRHHYFGEKTEENSVIGISQEAEQEKRKKSKILPCNKFCSMDLLETLTYFLPCGI